MEKHLEKDLWDAVSGIHQGRVSSDSRLMETHIWCLMAGSLGEVSGKEQRPLPALLPGRKQPSSSHPDARHFSAFLFVLVPLKLLPQHWSSELVSQSKFVHRPLKRNCLGCLKPIVSSSIPISFYSQKLWRLLFPELEPWTWWT